MGLRSLVSLTIFLVPVAITLGLLLGINAQRKALGQVPLFIDQGVSTTKYCQKSYGISPPSFGLSYTFNPNQWNWNVGDPGKLCMKVTQFNNATYATEETAPAFSVTWQYPQGPETAPVHAFPNIALDSDGTNLPIKVKDLKSMPVKIRWSYGLGTTKSKTTNIENLVAEQVNTNVAVDMFLDSDSKRAQSTINAKYEIMVWLATIGPSTQPIGFKKGPIATSTVNTTLFDLYHGKNSLGQWVLTWQAQTAIEDFVGDLGPLVSGIQQVAAAQPQIRNLPQPDDYLGYVGLGSEAYWTPQFVTFDVPHLEMNVF